MKTFRTLIQSGLSMMLLLGTATLFTGQAHAQFSSPIHDVDNAARQPVHFGAEVRFVDGSREGIVNMIFVVPAGKRLVIETITGEIRVPIGQQIQVFLTTALNPFATPTHSLLFNSKITDSQFQDDIYIATLPVRFYADPGTQPTLGVERNSTQGSTGEGEVSFSGYLVNLP